MSQQAKGVWPRISDPRLLEVFAGQVDGVIRDLQASTDDGLDKLAEALGRHPDSPVAACIRRALVDMQAIDRAMQRLRNIHGCLEEWIRSGPGVPGAGDPPWRERLEERYVMGDERTVLRRVL